MDDGLTIALEPRSAEAVDVINRALEIHTREMSGRPEPKHIHAILRDGSGALRGGVIAKLGADLLYIDSLWVDADLRDADYGTKLMALAEAEGRRLGATLAWVDTYSWQARPFYEKLGYCLFGELPYQGGKHARYFLRKAL